MVRKKINVTSKSIAMLTNAGKQNLKLLCIRVPIIIGGQLSRGSESAYLRSCSSKSSNMATRVVASATVRAVQKRMLPSRAALTLTPSAVNKIKKIMEKNGDQGFIGLKVGVKQRGCNGLSYTLDFTKEKGKLDEVVKQDGVTVIIDKKAQLSLLGTEMDYVEDKLSSEFVFNNPNIKGTCGCGESFSI